MQLCEEVANGLEARGHEISVVTSTDGVGLGPAVAYPVHRCLELEPDWERSESVAWGFFVGRQRREREALKMLDGLLDQARPQVVFIWHAIGIPRVLLQRAEERSIAVYYLANYLPELPDEYIQYWTVDPVHPVAKVLKPLLRRIALAQLKREGKPVSLRYENAICVSNFVRQRLVEQELLPLSAIVIHNGVNLVRFSSTEDVDFGADDFSCLVAGRIAPEKGIHTLVEAVAILANENASASRLKVLIIGDGPEEYVSGLKRKVESDGLGKFIRFAPAISRDEMPQVLQRHHALILPSEYAEPIARSMQEAMAMGLLVIGTTTGGSGELLKHQATGLVFEAGDPRSLADQIVFAINSPDAISLLARAGCDCVRQSFGIDQTIGRIESYLQHLLETQIDKVAGSQG